MQFHGAGKTAFQSAAVNIICGFFSILIAEFPALANFEGMKPLENQLSRRERQVMDILFRVGKATAQEVLDELSDPPSYSAVRALLATLETKGLVKHAKDSRRYVYSPAVPEKRAKRSALRQLLSTFFEGRPENLVASLLDPEDQQLSQEEIDRIRTLIDPK
jgi:BlaI family penicillinase repressor